MEPLRFLSFWSINDALDVSTACGQLEELQRLGLDGVIFHPRNYPGIPEYLSPAYMEKLSAIILHAKHLGMEFWLYDENGFPSGNASGKVLAEHPEVRSRWLTYENGQVQFHEKQEISALDEVGGQTFLRITFDGYRTGLSPEAFDWVTGFFSDEVSFQVESAAISCGGVPWCDGLEERYQARYGEPLREQLPLLFVDGPHCETVRARFWERMADLLAERFYGPINQWCQRYGKRYTAHLKAEENLFFGLSYHGSPFRVLRQVDVPAVDALERYPGNHYYPHIASSLARQFGDGTCLCEAMGGAGWGVSPEDFVRYMGWLTGCGINRFVFHIAQYSLKAQAIRDWPPSTPFHLTWKEAFPEVLRRVRVRAEEQWCLENTKGRILLIAPTRAVMERFKPSEAGGINEHNGAGVPDTPAGRVSKAFNDLVERCYQAGLAYDVTEESVLESCGEIGEDAVRIGKAEYYQVIPSPDCVFRDLAIWDRLAPFGREVPIAAPIMPEPEVPVQPLAQDSTPWRVRDAGENQILLPLCNGSCVFPVEGTISDLHLHASDPLAMSRITLSQDGGSLEIQAVPLPDGEQEPFVFLQGRFLVRSLSPYVSKGRQIYTEGPFCLSAVSSQTMDPEHLVESGYPFRGEPVLLEKTIALPEPAKTLSLQGFTGAAVRLQIGDAPAQWVFSTADRVPIPADLAGQTVSLRAELYPSTYNTYGPHHHYEGDRPLISPDQYSGKNFADRLDAPACTLVSGWHFVPLGLERGVRFWP